MKTENQVYADLIGFINTALSSEGISGWNVLQSYQQTRGNFPSPYILIHKLVNTFIGQLQQNSVDSTKSGQLKQVSFQIDGYKKRLPTDKEDTLSGGDVVEVIRNWFMSDEAQKILRSKGYNVFRVGQVNHAYFETETDVYQVNPNFTLDLTYKQKYGKETSAISGAVGNLEGI